MLSLSTFLYYRGCDISVGILFVLYNEYNKYRWVEMIDMMANY